MTTHTHTAGPWKVDSSEKETYVILEGLRYSDYVCKMATDNARANAALIAAAPELLDALEQIIADAIDAEYNRANGLPTVTQASINAARAAIARAKGGD